MIDYSSPNVAKPMHVGHIRSTVIGDSLARIFRSWATRVVSDNHLGDWGTQFGMILWGWKTARDEPAFAADPVAELARFYRLAQDRIKAGDLSVEDAARAETAYLHAGDAENRRLWNEFMPFCLQEIESIYARLGVRFDVELGESFYDPMLAGVVDDLLSRGIAKESEGAIAVFTKGTKAPFMIRKSDGAFNYGTTDLATIKYRAETWNPELVLYVVDHRQGDHFKQLFEVSRKWGYDRLELVHVAFGTILGPDRKPFKTREGDAVGLESLLDEAVAEARKVVDANSPDLDPDARAKVAEVVGLGAIKYADLSQNRLSDYVFDWQKMLAMNGNTATYMQYAYARIQSIFRKGAIDPALVRRRPPPEIVLNHPAERAPGRAHPSPPRGSRSGRRRAQTEHPDRLPLRPGQRVFHVLRGMPRAQGRLGTAAGQSPGDLRPDGADLAVRPQPAWNRCRPANVSSPLSAPRSGPDARANGQDLHMRGHKKAPSWRRRGEVQS